MIFPQFLQIILFSFSFEKKKTRSKRDLFLRLLKQLDTEIINVNATCHIIIEAQ